MIGVLAARRHGAYSFLTCARTQTFIQRYMETLEQRIQRVAQEDVAITPYDPRWPELFRQEKGHLLNCLPNELIRRIEHFGSTAVPGLAANIIGLRRVSEVASRVRLDDPAKSQPRL